MKQGHIVVLPIPFTDLTSSKQRPCLIISNDQINNQTEDIVVLAITSNNTSKNNDLNVQIKQSNIQSGILPKTSYIKLQKIYTIHKKLVRKTVCELTPTVTKKVLNKFIQSVF